MENELKTEVIWGYVGIMCGRAFVVAFSWVSYRVPQEYW